MVHRSLGSLSMIAARCSLRRNLGTRNVVGLDSHWPHFTQRMTGEQRQYRWLNATAARSLNEATA